MTLDGGLWVALATPFRSDGALDLLAFAKLIAHVRAGFTDALVVLGSTGEATAIEALERDTLIKVALENASGTPVVVGCTASATAEACRFAVRAQALGAHGALIATPPYVKPSQAGILAHFAAIAKAAPGLPLIAYNIPSRCGVGMTLATVQELWRMPAVHGLKESSGDLAHIAAIAAITQRDKLLLAGDDVLALPSIALGACGLVSVAGNIVPQAMRQLVHAALEGELHTARAQHEQLVPLLHELFTEPNPVPLKAALALCDIGTDMVRLPLLTAQLTTRDRIAALLHKLGALA
ncbi:4-hydroxy-tetrahydrodipicolinate synthase [Planctomycetota bacterium]|nr:4-hydroxy-tetrahydrodipicolinate synthase [Planctomycetota bacterium]GDY03522.1 4-hydroxy-tetrahydrodipicolinate synthase [Planctomycetota bacterium]